jgi:hypothetical protein
MQALAGLAGIPTADSVKTSAMKPLTDFLNNGIQVDKVGLAVLAGIIPIPPLSYLGNGGMNLWAVGSMKYCAMKAGLQALCTLANNLIMAKFPKFWFLAYLFSFSPWYIFDILQLFSPAFEKEGFKVPFFNTKISTSPQPAVGKLTPALLVAAFALLSSGSYSLLNFFPDSVQKTWKPIMNMIFLAIGSVTALAGGGIGGVVVLPEILSSLRGERNKISEALATPAPPAQPSQKGGGDSLPSLGEIANRIIKDEIDCPTKMQSGGGDGNDAANIFIGSLVVASLGGIILALVRQKTVSLP